MVKGQTTTERATLAVAHIENCSQFLMWTNNSDVIRRVLTLCLDAERTNNADVHVQPNYRKTALGQGRTDRISLTHDFDIDL